MSDVIAHVRSKLSRYPNVAYEETSSSILVHPQDDAGFEVGLVVDETETRVFMEGWHEHFESESDALDCLAFGLSSQCRLLVVSYGATPVSWTVEALRGEVWVADSTTGLILRPFWRPRRSVYKQNRLLDWSATSPDVADDPSAGS